MEMGYHNLFFPGGTRARSGAVETRLKKGLLGSALAAYINNLQAGRPKPNLFVVPCTLSYELVLEAETLIDDHLKRQGQARYIIDDDEFSRPRVVLDFLGKLASLDSRILLTVGRPMDLFGNPVDTQGRSLDARGRPVDPRRYVTTGGEPVHAPQRDEQYTRELAAAIGASYLRNNVISPTNLLGAALFRMLRRANPDLDLFRLLRTGGDVVSFPMQEVHANVQRWLDALNDLPVAPRLSAVLQRGDVPDVVADALKHFGTFHSRPAAVRRGDRVFPDHRNLLLYYGNRLQGYDLERRLDRAEQERSEP